MLNTLQYTLWIHIFAKKDYEISHSSLTITLDKFQFPYSNIFTSSNSILANLISKQLKSSPWTFLCSSLVHHFSSPCLAFSPPQLVGEECEEQPCLLPLFLLACRCTVPRLRWTPSSVSAGLSLSSRRRRGRKTHPPASENVECYPVFFS